MKITGKGGKLRRPVEASLHYALVCNLILISSIAGKHVARKQTRSGSYPEKCRERVKAGNALTYLIDVANGDAKPVQGRIDTCKYLLNKAWPDLPKEQISYEGEKIPDYIVKYGD